MKNTSPRSASPSKGVSHGHIILGNSYPTLPLWRLRIHIRILVACRVVVAAAKHEVTDSQTHFTLESLSHVIPDHLLEQLVEHILTSFSRSEYVSAGKLALPLFRKCY